MADGIAKIDFARGDMVVVVGLVKATQLNGKTGVVLSPACLQKKSNRVVVQLDEPSLGSKHFKPENLREYPMNKDHPSLCFLGDEGVTTISPSTGENRYPLVIENGAGKVCKDWGRDLEGIFHVFREDWFYEEHYTWRYNRNQYKLCSLCHDLFWTRKRLETSIQSVLPDGRKITAMGLFWAHKKCFTHSSMKITRPHVH